MTPLKRTARRKAPPIVVRVRRIKHTGHPPLRPVVRRSDAAPATAGPVSDPQA
jgi:hypothetical protein